jgi:pimeloyl-ACP methyl ester carboxylesterase
VRSATERFVVANGLRHRVLEWDGGGEATLVLLHGFLDHARTWEATVEHLPRSWHVVAFDWRGHGGSDPVGAGGYYHFIDYVFDLADLVAEVGRGRLALCGHSMGGVVASLYAGVFPAHVTRLMLVEGLGPPADRPDDAPARVERWIREVRALRAKPPRPLPTLQDAARRLQINNPLLSRERALALAEAGTRAAPGGYLWAFDPLHRTRSPSPYLIEVVSTFWRRVTCPVALVRGARSWLQVPDLDRRVACFSEVAASYVIEGAGHAIQTDAPEELARLMRAFLDPVLSGAS